MKDYNPVETGNKHLIPTTNTDSQLMSYLKGTLDGLLLCEGGIGLDHSRNDILRDTIRNVKRQIGELKSKYSARGVF